MATYDEYGPTRDEIRDAFNKAAAEGKQQYLLLINETLSDPAAVTNYTLMRTVEKPCAIVPLLQDMDKRSPYAAHGLSHVLDLKKDFDAQMAQWGKKDFAELLPAFVVKDLATRQEEKDYERRREEWDSQPFFTRLFSTPPMRRK